MTIDVDSDDDNSIWPTAQPIVCEELPEDDSLEESSSPSIQKEHDELLYAGCEITFWESFSAILTFAQSEKISGAGLGRLISLIALHLPKDSKFFSSTHELLKLLDGHDEPVQVHYVCSSCYKHRTSDTDLCDTCTDEAKRVDFFISFPIVPQVTKKYKRPDFISDIKYKHRRVKKHPDNYEDVYDGEVYKEAEKGLLANDTNISFTWNADGLQIYDSSPYSLTPFFLVINELPPEKRFLSENMIIGGIWGSSIKPHPNVFLHPVYKDMVNLRNGIDVKFFGDDELHKVHAIMLCGVCDAPARASFLNMKSHSGFYSCHICLCRGVRPGDVTVFPYEEHFRLRTKALYDQQVTWAVNNRVPLNKLLLNRPECSGIKGPTLVSDMVENNNPLSTTAVDSMHCIYLGMMRQLVHLWFDHAQREEPFSVHDKIKIVNRRMRQMTPPHFIQRFPQAVDKLVYWKASELRAFLFFISLCVLKGVLKSELYDHFMLLVQGIYLLNTCSISPDDVNLSNMLLNQFVCQFQELYGLRHMSHNLHMLLHLGLMVQRLGPLCLINCFPFEDMNGRLTRWIHGTRHAGLQIHSHLSVITDLPLIVNNLCDGPTKKYCMGLLRKSMRLKLGEKIAKGQHCIGNMYKFTDQFHWLIDVLAQANVFISVDRITIFHRFLKNRLLYVSSSYGRGQRVSSFVKYVQGNEIRYGNVQVFLKLAVCQCSGECSCTPKYVAVIQKLKTNVAFQNNNVLVSHIFTYLPSEEREVVSVSDLCFVLYTVNVDDGQVYICIPPNKYELE